MQIPYVLRAAGALLLAGLTLITTSHAQTIYVWDGSAGTNWSTAANWLDGTVPVDAAAAPENIIGFDANSAENLSMIMDLSSGFDLSKIIVQNPAADILIRPVNKSSRTIDLWGAAGDPVSIDMSGATRDLSFGMNGTGTLTLNVANASQTWNVAGGRTLTTVDVDGSTGQILTLTGGGTIVLGGASSDNSSLRVTVTGAGTVVNLAKTSTGTIHALGGNATSTIGANTTMRITGAGGDQIFSQHDMQIDGTLDLNGNSEGFDLLTSGTGITTGVITSSAAGNITLRINEINNTTSTVTYAGRIENGSAVLSLVKASISTQVFTGNNTYTGSTLVSRGLLQLTGTDGALSNTSGIVLDGAGELRLDSRTAPTGYTAGLNSDRIEDTADIDMQGGTFGVYGSIAGNVNEVVADISATMGNNVIRLSSDNAVGTASTGITAASISRSAGSTINIVGDNVTGLGTTTAGDVAFFRVAAGSVLPSMLSGASGTGVNRDILIGVFGSSSATSANASELMTVETGDGGFDYLRPLTAAEYATLTSGQFVESNAAQTANTTLSQSAAYNALKISGGNLTMGSNKTLYLGGHAADAVSSTVTEGAGMLLFTSASSISGGTSILGTIDFGGREAIIRATGGTVNIEARITGTGGLNKTGSSTVGLANANTYTGTTLVNEGILQVKNDRALGAAGGGVVVLGSGSNTGLQLANGVNVTGENITLGASGGAQVFFGSANASHNTWTGNVVAANINLAGRPDQDSQIQVGTDAALTIYGNVYAEGGSAPIDPLGMPIFCAESVSPTAAPVW